MTCGFCEYKFCWTCKEEATYEHFRNPLSNCYGTLMADNPPNACCRVACNILKWIGILLLVLVLGPILLVLFLVFVTPVACVALSHKCFHSCCGPSGAACLVTILLAP